MKRVMIFVILNWMFLAAGAQIKISGLVKNTDGEPVKDVRVSFKEAFEFSTTNEKGIFQLELEDTGTYNIIAEKEGFSILEKEISFPELKAYQLELQFQYKNRSLGRVVVKSNGFSKTSDRNRAVIMNKFDILTTAGANADIIAAFKTLPGTQQGVAEDGLFVRGGRGNETQTFIDGMLVNNFFYSGAPDVSHRGRFPPALFKGTHFASGAYSAQYGQALSAAVILESQDVLTNSSLDFNIGSAGAGVALNKLSPGNSRFSYGGTFNYLNLKPYYSIIKQKYDFTRAPQFLDGTVNFRIRGKKNNSILKFYASSATSNLELFRENIDYAYRRDLFGLINHNYYTNLVYAFTNKKRWQVETGSSFSWNKDEYHLGFKDAGAALNDYRSQKSNSLFQLRNSWKKTLFGKLRLVTGAEYQRLNRAIATPGENRNYTDNYLGAFAEGNYNVSKTVAARLGFRGEYTSLLRKWTLSPRMLLTINLEQEAQFNLSYGQFVQKPEDEILLYKRDLNLAKANHYILGFQKNREDKYLFRTEIYYKDYRRLISTLGGDTTMNGNGYVKGLELFWKQKFKEKEFEYWLSYTYLDSKRQFAGYPQLTQPDFVSNHSFSAVVKRYFSQLSMHMAFTYNFESGKPYYNPNRTLKEFLTDKTIDFHNFNTSLAYVRSIGKVHSIFVCTISNVFNNRQIFGYRYSRIDTNRRQPLTPMASRFIFLGAFFSLGIDKTRDIFNNNL